MKFGSALIWFSCFCWASDDTSSPPRFAASWLVYSLFAVRYPLSAPIWEKHTTTFFLPPESLLSQEERNPQLTARTADINLIEREGNDRGFFILLIKNL